MHQNDRRETILCENPILTVERMMSLLFLFSLSIQATAAPLQVTHQGRLLDSDGDGLTGDHEMHFILLDDEFGGTTHWNETLTVTFDNGFYSVILGMDEEDNPLDEAVLSNSPLFLELRLDGDILNPRHRLTSAPFAQMANTAESLDGGPVNASEIAVNDIPIIDSNGLWIGPGAQTDWQDIQNMPADIADGDDDQLGGLSCGAGDIVGWDGANWTCLANNGLSESQVEAFVTNDPIDLAPGSTMGGSALLTENSAISPDWSAIQNRPAGLDDGDDDSLGATVCGAGELLIYSGNAWTCGQDTDTTLTALEVKTMVESMQLALTGPLTVDGNQVLTDASTIMPDWLTIQNRPAGLDDGDDSIQDIVCNHGDVLSYDSLIGDWVCGNAFDNDNDGVYSWMDCDDYDPNSLAMADDQDCDGTITADDCNDSDSSSTTVFTDADCDGVLTADDCDDNNSGLGDQTYDADCDGSLIGADGNDSDSSISPGATEINCDGIDQNCDGIDGPCQFEFAATQTIGGETVTCSSVTNNGIYTQCNDLLVDGMYMPNGVTCGPAWDTGESYDQDKFCQYLTGSLNFEIYYNCGPHTPRAVWQPNSSSWSLGSNNDNGYSQHVRCYY